MKWTQWRADRPVPADSRPGGRLAGGPGSLGALILILALALAGCSGSGGGTQTRQPAPRRGEAVMRPLSIYEQLGMVAGTEEFPAVASFFTLAGPADSTYVLFGLSLPNNALMFQRDGDTGFVGRYSIALTFMQGDRVVRRAGGKEEVRVPTFAETGRTDESVVYQTLVALEPGSYTVEVEAWDESVEGKRVKTRESLVVPAYRNGGRRLAGPFVVYRADGRDTPAERPGLIVNPRSTIPYGSESIKVYFEGYDIPHDVPVSLRVIGPNDEDIWQKEIELSREEAGELTHLVVDLPGSALPLGRLWVETTFGSDAEAVVERKPLVVTVSDQWMVNNFDEMLEFLSFIATDAELDSLRNADPGERAVLWERFWNRRDPAAAGSPLMENTFRDRFFERLRLASVYFSEPGRPGWKTDRGEVFIVLGPPHYIMDRYLQSTSATPDVYDWVYEDGPLGRLVLTFTDRYNMQRYELTPSSRIAFRSAANQLKERYTQR